jgi:uncharacterized protein YkwD
VRHRPTPPPAPAPGPSRAAAGARRRPAQPHPQPRPRPRWTPLLALTVLMSLALIGPALVGPASPLLDGAGQGGGVTAAPVPAEDLLGGTGRAELGGTPVVPPVAPVAVPPAAATPDGASPTTPPSADPSSTAPSSTAPASTAAPSTAAPAAGASSARTTSKAAPAPRPVPAPAPAPVPAPAPPPVPAPAAAAPAGGDAGRVLALVNEARAGAGCGPVTADTGLAGVSRGHSEAMRDRNFFAHTDLDGRSPFDRAARAGVTNARAENIARGQQDAAAVMDAWLTSPGHRQNILNCDYRTMGLGVATGSGGPWWTQMFGA